MLELVDVHIILGESSFSREFGGGEKNSVAVLLGRNGMGKTTTIRSIVGFTPPRRGSVRFNGTDITSLPSYQIVKWE